MKTYVVLGTQWGDEGKGKIIDAISPQADYVVRYQGGNNAGHTVIVNNEKFVLHLLPSGIIHAKSKCIIGSGVVVDIDVLLQEIEGLEARGKKLDHLFIDQRAHVILPYHISLDKLKEQNMGNHKIGTTQRGVGPCYIDKFSRIGIRIADLFDENLLREKIEYNLQEKNPLLIQNSQDPFKLEKLLEKMLELGKKIEHRVIDAVLDVNQAIEQNKFVLFEGAQATMLDIDFGTYPYVTSSSPTAGGVSTGTGVSPKKIDRIMGVMKAYTTRVGEGPFPTELNNEIGEQLQKNGGEFGATTGRARKCGWLDLVMGRYAVMVNGLTDVILTKIDILTGIQTLKVAVGYRMDGKEYDIYPGFISQSGGLEVIYKEFPGWKEDISKIRNFSELPENCKKYIEYIESFLNCNVSMVSVGSERSQNIFRHPLGIPGIDG